MDYNNTNNANNTIVFMDSRQDVKEGGGRISVKDIRRSAACLLCRNRKRKCDGQDPCSYISSFYRSLTLFTPLFIIVHFYTFNNDLKTIIIIISCGLQF
jgi:hypothetical protein